jgi:O-antigen ligase
VVGPLGAAGSPAALFGLACLGWWATSRMLPSLPMARGFQPVRVVLGLYVAATLMSYLVGNTTPLNADELSGADRGLLTVASWCGLCFVGADMLHNKAAVEKLLKRIVVLCAVIGVIGVIQFMTGIDPAGFVRIPGLSVNGVYQAIQTGGVLRRVGGTASHPIEYGMVLALGLPFALHYSLLAETRKRWWWAMTIVIAVALPMSLSRSAMLGLFFEFFILFASWSPARRIAALKIAPVFVVGMRILVPGLVGTMFSLFANAGDDPSLQGRADSRAAAGAVIGRYPWFGRGYNTYILTNFRELGLVGVNHGSLDNQYLGTVVEMGFVGLAALLMLMIASSCVARGIRIRAQDQPTRDLGQAFLAAFVAVAVGMATFDGLGFPMFTGQYFLLLGLAGALWRITRDEWRAAQIIGPRVTLARANAVSSPEA